ncbi:MAG: hypothetical protein DCC67_10725 [Planctomycetota bacterium]|nr:MAG: hypothetical protein DCC67_10725 [Planctomycetota bacterium]
MIVQQRGANKDREILLGIDVNAIPIRKYRRLAIAGKGASAPASRPRLLAGGYGHAASLVRDGSPVPLGESLLTRRRGIDE